MKISPKFGVILFYCQKLRFTVTKTIVIYLTQKVTALKLII